MTRSLSLQAALAGAVLLAAAPAGAVLPEPAGDPDIAAAVGMIDAGRDRLAMNFERAAELTAVPDDRILEIYNALRPYRSTKEELLTIADDLESRYQAKICAAFVREAATLYVERKKLKGDD